jgi:hypothetical protein
VPEFKHDPVLALRVIGQDYSEKVRRGYIGNKITQDTIRSAHFHVIDPWPLITSGNIMHASRNGTLLFSDQDHVTQQGAALIKNAFRAIFDKITNSK